MCVCRCLCALLCKKQTQNDDDHDDEFYFELNNSYIPISPPFDFSSFSTFAFTNSEFLLLYLDEFIQTETTEKNHK